MNADGAHDVLVEIQGCVHSAHLDDLHQIMEDLREDRLVYLDEILFDDLLFALQAELLEKNVTAEDRLEKALWADAMKTHGETVAIVQRIDHMLAEAEEDTTEGGDR